MLGRGPVARGTEGVDQNCERRKILGAKTGAPLGDRSEVIGQFQVRPGHRQPAKTADFVVEVNALRAAAMRVRDPFELAAVKQMERVRYAETLRLNSSRRCSSSGLPVTVGCA